MYLTWIWPFCPLPPPFPFPLFSSTFAGSTRVIFTVPSAPPFPTSIALSALCSVCTRVSSMDQKRWRRRVRRYQSTTRSRLCSGCASTTWSMESKGMGGLIGEGSKIKVVEGSK